MAMRASLSSRLGASKVWPEPLPGAGDDLHADRVVLDRYKVIPGGLLGEGSWCVVWRAQDLKSGLSVAVKTFRFEAVQEVADSQLASRFAREVATFRALGLCEGGGGPAVPVGARSVPLMSLSGAANQTSADARHLFVKLLDFSRGADAGSRPGPAADGCYYTVLELAEETLESFMRRRPYGLREVREVARVVAEGLDVLHTHGICHLDINPSNIMRFGSDWKIIDLEGCLPEGPDNMLYMEASHVRPLHVSPEVANALVIASPAPRAMASTPSRKSMRGVREGRRSRSKEGLGGHDAYVRAELHLRPSTKLDLWSAGVLLMDVLAHKRAFEATFLQLQQQSNLLKSEDKDSKSEMEASESVGLETWYKWLSSDAAIDIAEHILEPKASLDMLRKSTDLQNLLDSLLAKRPSARISAEAFKQHPWLTDARRDALIRLGALKEEVQPIAPRSVTEPVDVSKAQATTATDGSRLRPLSDELQPSEAQRRSSSPSPALVHLALSQGVDPSKAMGSQADAGCPQGMPPSPEALPIPKVSSAGIAVNGTKIEAAALQENGAALADSSERLRGASAASPGGSKDFEAPTTQDVLPTPGCISDPRAPSEEVAVIAFPAGPADARAEEGSLFLATSFDVSSSKLLELRAPRCPEMSRRFKNVDAAFQALRCWEKAAELESMSAEAALSYGLQLDKEDRTHGGYGGKWTGMLAILCQKFAPNSPWLKALQQTGDAYLLSHGSNGLEPALWSDMDDGTGRNWMGLQLMLIRDMLQEASRDKALPRHKNWSEFIRSCGMDLPSGEVAGADGASQWQDLVRAACRAEHARRAATTHGVARVQEQTLSSLPASGGDLAPVVSRLVEALPRVGQSGLSGGTGHTADASGRATAVFQAHDAETRASIDRSQFFGVLRQAEPSLTEMLMDRILTVSAAERPAGVDYNLFVRWLFHTDCARKLATVADAGGRIGGELRGASESDNLDFVAMCVEEPGGEVGLLLECLHAMNAPRAEVAPSGSGYQDGGSAHVGKMIFSADADQIAIVAYVPEARKADVSAADWLETVLQASGGEVVSRGAAVSSGRIDLKPLAGFGMQKMEPLLAAANGFLCQRGLSKPDETFLR
mmetsp:Transcript_7834/g.18255  ORF Transcript_7834/g.18255 Transcript_7834/m.18255 type:complete len:1108 (-) Transcript_7834:102-3425(-)